MGTTFAGINEARARAARPDMSLGSGSWGQNAAEIHRIQREVAQQQKSGLYNPGSIEAQNQQNLMRQLGGNITGGAAGGIFGGVQYAPGQRTWNQNIPAGDLPKMKFGTVYDPIPKAPLSGGLLFSGGLLSRMRNFGFNRR